MNFRYTFIENDYEVILRNAESLIPGIDKVVAIYFDQSSGQLQSRVKDKNGSNGVDHLSMGDQIEFVAQMRVEKLKYNWLNRSDLPFELHKRGEIVKEIFGEMENTVLLLRFFNPNDKLSDLVYIYFKPNLSNFGLFASHKLLSTENKSIIASLLYNSFKTLIDLNRQNKSLFETINENTKSVIRTAASLKEQLNQTHTSYGESLLNLSRQYLKEMGRTNGKSYILTEDAAEKIKHFNGNINHLYSIIKNALIYVDNLYFDEKRKEIEINEWEINTDNYQVNNESDTSGTALMEEKYVKTVTLLDKLENAARTVLSNNGRLTGLNVGKACPTSITAPAITDALRKHKKKIIVLFNKYPDKWEVIRNKFKPVKNITVA